MSASCKKLTVKSDTNPYIGQFTEQQCLNES